MDPYIRDFITTYADGFGRWHALVPAGINSRELAKEAILEELVQREATVSPRLSQSRVGELEDYLSEDGNVIRVESVIGHHYVEYAI